MQQPQHSDFDTLEIRRPAVTPTAAPAEARQVRDELVDLWWALWSRKLLIASIVGASVIMCLTYLHLATPLYTANTEIFIDPRQKKITGVEVVPSGLGNSALGADTALVESQVAIMKSESVTDALIAALHLDKDREFAGDSGNSLVNLAANSMRFLLYGDVETYQRSPHDKAKRKLAKRLDIERLGNTYVVRIQARSEDPRKAAMLTNLLAEIYTVQSRDYSTTSTQSAADDISGRLIDLREKMQESARAVEQFREANGLVGAQNVLISEQQLFEVNRTLSDARAATRIAKSNLDQARQALANPMSADLNGLESSLALSLLSRLADARSQQATLRTTLLPKHPRLTAIGEQIASIESAIRAELERVVTRYESTYRVAQQNEAALSDQVADLQQETASSNSVSVRLHELQLEADLNRRIYEDLRARSNQINEEVGIELSNTRIVSSAYPASHPSHPKGPLLLAAAFLGGLLIGCFAAWCLHILNGTERKPSRHKQRPARRPVTQDLEPVVATVSPVARSFQGSAS